MDALIQENIKELIRYAYGDTSEGSVVLTYDFGTGNLDIENCSRLTRLRDENGVPVPPPPIPKALENPSEVQDRRGVPEAIRKAIEEDLEVGRRGG